MKYLKCFSLCALAFLPLLSNAAKPKEYSLLNNSNYHLLFDKTWQSHSTCINTALSEESAEPQSTIKFTIDTDWDNNKCIWAGRGYKIINASNGAYAGYLSVNIQHESSWRYSSQVTLPNNTKCSLIRYGTGTTGIFGGPCQ